MLWENVSHLIIFQEMKWIIKGIEDYISIIWLHFYTISSTNHSKIESVQMSQRMRQKEAVQEL